jgi:hypothetical protein
MGAGPIKAGHRLGKGDKVGPLLSTPKNLQLDSGNINLPPGGWARV